MKQYKKLDSAFMDLKKLGYIAEKDFWCCSSCAWADIGEYKKVVFYNTQSADSFKKTGKVHLQWNGNGKQIVKVLKENGLKVEWDGTKDNTILVDIN